MMGRGRGERSCERGQVDMLKYCRSSDVYLHLPSHTASPVPRIVDRQRLSCLFVSTPTERLGSPLESCSVLSWDCSSLRSRLCFGKPRCLPSLVLPKLAIPGSIPANVVHLRLIAQQAPQANLNGQDVEKLPVAYPVIWSGEGVKRRCPSSISCR